MALPQKLSEGDGMWGKDREQRHNLSPAGPHSGGQGTLPGPLPRALGLFGVCPQASAQAVTMSQGPDTKRSMALAQAVTLEMGQGCRQAARAVKKPYSLLLLLGLTLL